MKNFRAPWGWTLRSSSIIAAVVCLGGASIDFATPKGSPLAPYFLNFWVPILFLALLLGTALFTIRGYTVTNEAILVHRLFWDTRLPREGLVSATVEPRALSWSLRICGNGGMFSFSGWFWSKKLGRFQAYATDLNRTVVLRWEKRTAVVSPDDPEGFVREVLG